MFSFETLFPCMKLHKSRHRVQLETETVIQTADIRRKKADLKVSANELEQTVREFLDDRQAFQVKRNER